MPSSSSSTTSEGTPRTAEVMGATVTVDKYTTALSRVEGPLPDFFRLVEQIDLPA